MVYPNGMFVKRRENAPSFLLASISIDTLKFVEWLKQNTNGKGYCNIDIKQGNTGPYASLNEWSPEKQEIKTEKIEESDENEEINEIKVDNIPF